MSQGIVIVGYIHTYICVIYIYRLYIYIHIHWYIYINTENLLRKNLRVPSKEFERHGLLLFINLSDE